MPGLKVELEKDAKIRALLGERLTPNAIHRQLGVHASVVLRIRDEMLANGTLSRDAVIPGYRIARVSSDGQGKEWVTQKPAPSDETFRSARGAHGQGRLGPARPRRAHHPAMGQDAGGRMIDIVEALKKTFAEYEGNAELRPGRAPMSDEDLSRSTISPTITSASSPGARRRARHMT
jgi:hypothetical protein